MGIPIHQGPSSFPSTNIASPTSPKPSAYPTAMPKPEVRSMQTWLERGTSGGSCKPINDQRIRPSQIEIALKATFGSECSF